MAGSAAEVSIGIDFGTTNSSIALAYPGDYGAPTRGHTESARGEVETARSEVEIVRFPTRSGATESFRSVVYLEQVRSSGRIGAPYTVKSLTGPAAVEEYLTGEREDDGRRGRLIQSLKSYLTSHTLTGKEIFGRRFGLEDLIAMMLSNLRLAAERHLGRPIRRATVGRPVRFVGAESEADDNFALERLRAAFLQAGFDEVRFEMEPIGAAFAYEATLTRDELILIGDFGGGTSDFSLLRVGPSAREARARGRSSGLLGNAGLGLAGDAFDARIVRRLVSPALGLDSYERVTSSINGRKLIPAVPSWIYTNLERWHYLSFLKTRSVAELLRGAKLRAAEPEKVEALIALIDEDLGYQLHQAVERLKVELSRAEHARFRFRDGTVQIEAEVTRAEFEEWIAGELAQIEDCIDGLLASTGIPANRIDRVFLTGGTSFVPAVRRIFERRFGPERVRTGGEFTSVARGLALRGLEE